MASRLDVANDDDDDDDDNSDSDSDNDSPPASSFTKDGREPSSNAHIASEQDENDVEMKSASDSNDDDDDDDGGGGGEKQAALEDKRSTSHGSEVKIEDQRRPLDPFV